MNDKAKSDTSNNTIDYLKSVRDIAFVIAVFLYYMGWIYIYYYLTSFGLSIKAADSDIYNFFIYSTNVFIYVFNNEKLNFLILILFFIGLFSWKRLSFIAHKSIPFIVVLFFPVVFVTAKKAAESDAYKVRMHPLSTLKSIEFIFKEEKADISAEVKLQKDSLSEFNNIEKARVLNQNHLGGFRLLLSSKDEYYVILVSNRKIEENDVPVIYIIKNDVVEFTQITK